MNIDYIKKLITQLGFAPQDGTNGIYVKHYVPCNNYPIFIDFNENKIEYACQSIQPEKRIRLGDLTTSNFEKLENFVVLECVDRLLSKGYRPERLELEKKYPLGRNLKGKLDILVYNENDDIPFLMIECKTWGSEYEKESAKTRKDGGQIFSYYQQDRATKFLCLYASRLDRGQIEYKNSIVLVEESWKDLSSAKDICDYWNKNFKDNGIFEAYATPYDIKPKALTYGMLENLKEEDSGKIYNQIMEILRHNAISDKPNAFNKLLNLFVCKIIDENQNPTDELGFQWLETDNDESLQMRLNDLYKEGMWRFLEIKVIDHSEEDVTKALDGIDDYIQKQRLMDMFRDARLKKSPNFAFVEVLDEKTFKLNAKIVREIIELLQVYKFRYEQKHEFLGNFFELLLNTSMKQEAGQFFTPVPITRFIISSLPLKEFVQSQIDSRARNILPAVIDYACGSGHFLTEYMDQMQAVIDSKIDTSLASPNVRNTIQSWQGLTKFLWAKDFVYGIDLDNRLVKTTKVSAFFNGDGEANIIWANGLDSFEKTEEYRHLLRQVDPYDKKNNGQFDILISNPPYSVEAFKSTLKYGEETFEMYNNLTDNSSEIECLFVERTKQLLKVGGWAGVVLPSSILSNGGIHSKAREILFKYFKVKAITELGSGTFMKTNTSTIVLFLERRADSDFTTIEKAINTFMSNLKDVAVMGIENAFSMYISNVYDNLAFDDYCSLVAGKANVAMQKHELYLDYKKLFGDDVYSKAIALEKEKMLYFLLTYEQNIVLVKTGQKQEEKTFLGYEFSDRRGHEGIKYFSSGTKLYDESGNVLNEQKANSYIYNAFLDKTVDVHESLARNVSYGRMSEFINYGTSRFDKVVNFKKRVEINSRFKLHTLESISLLIKRGKSASYGGSSVRIIKSGQARGYEEFDFEEQYFVSENFVSDERNLLRGDILINSTGVGTAGRVTLFNLEGDFVADSHITIVRLNKKIALPKYVLYALAKIGFKNIEAMANGQSGQIELPLETISNIKIPLPPVETQKQIIIECESVEKEIAETTTRLHSAQDRTKTQFIEMLGDPITNPRRWSIAKFSEVTEKIGSGATPKGGKGSYVNVGVSLVRSMNVYNGYFKYEGLAHITDTQAERLDNVTVKENDILFNITGASVARSCIIPDDVLPARVNQHVSIIRCDPSCLNHRFANLVITSDRYQAFLISLGESSGMTRQAITKQQIENLLIPVPPLSKQNEIVAEVQQIESEIASLKLHLDELAFQKEQVLKKHL